MKIWRTGRCQYLVRFRPKSLGPKAALLTVGIRPGYTANPATLRGVGIFGCRPNWVPCNYADNYSGTFEVYNRQVAPPHPSGTYNSGSWDMSITVTVNHGRAFCDGSQDDKEQEFDNNFLTSEGTVKGTIFGPGLFAIEIEGSGSALRYKISAACPTADLKISSKDYVRGLNHNGRPQLLVESSSSTVPAEPVKHGRPEYFTDPLPANGFFSGAGFDLTGTQSDPIATPSSSNGASGVSRFIWNLKRW